MLLQASLVKELKFRNRRIVVIIHERYFRKLPSFKTMKNLFKILAGLMLLVFCQKGLGQNKFFHLTYKPTSSVLIDTTWAYDQYDPYEHSVDLAGFDSLDVILTPKYFATISYDPHYRIHEVYNRKTRILRRHLSYPGKDYFAEDSVMYYLHKDKALRQKAARLKDTLLIREHPEIHKTIHGRKCHLITFPPYGWMYTEMDSFWVSNFKNVPGLLSPFYYLTRGVAFEQVKNDGLLSVRVSSEKRPSSNPSGDIFTIDPGNSELHQQQTQHKIADVVNFVLSFKARLP